MTAYRIARATAALALAAALVGGPVVVGAPTAAQASTSCLEPRADVASGATFTVTSGTVASGGTISFTGTGFERTDTDGLGQTLAFKLNDQVQWAQTITADDDGNVSGSLSLADLPAADVADIVDQACGQAWLRVLVGSSAAGDMAPSRSLYATFELTAALGASATPTPISTSGASHSATGQLPQTGIEDTPPLVWIAGLAGVAVVAVVAERAVRRRASRAG